MSAVLLVENLLIFGLAVLGGQGLVRLFAHRRITKPAPPLDRREIALTLSTVFLNTAVTLAGLYLWRLGVITFRTDMGARALLDVVVLFLCMDFAMYFLHRIAHHPWIYPFLHKPHHAYTNPRPLTLFVLHPAEAISFGGLWLLFITVYNTSWLGMSIYLALNVLFGAVGHLGVEPLPARWMNIPIVRHFTTSTFHAGHHQNLHHNYGFYTDIWDKLLRTLSPHYQENFNNAGVPGSWESDPQEP